MIQLNAESIITQARQKQSRKREEQSKAQHTDTKRKGTHKDHTLSLPRPQLPPIIVCSSPPDLTTYLAKGAFSRCFQTNDTNIVCKVIALNNSSDNAPDNKRHKATISALERHYKRQQLYLQREIDIHSQLNHPHIVKLYEVRHGGNYCFLFLEKCKGGSLESYVSKHSRSSVDKVKSWGKQLLFALNYLHNTCHVFHRDIKTANILIDSKGQTVKLADFGFAIQCKTPDQDTTGELCGTPNYMAPEIVKGKNYTAAADVWSFGVLLFVLVCGRPPFEDVDLNATYSRILNISYTFSPEDIKHVSSEARNVIVSLLQPKEKRPTVVQLLNNNFFK